MPPQPVANRSSFANHHDEAIARILGPPMAGRGRFRFSYQPMWGCIERRRARGATADTGNELIYTVSHPELGTVDRRNGPWAIPNTRQSHGTTSSAVS
ncbi:MAG: hypothetical protein K8U57_15025 [Planctomycetes bacterium]|nr:hypothetical protein [Planctomycetota bacterium]